MQLLLEKHSVWENVSVIVFSIIALLSELNMMLPTCEYRSHVNNSFAISGNIPVETNSEKSDTSGRKIEIIPGIDSSNCSLAALLITL